MQHLRQAELFEERTHLLFLLSHLRELSLGNLLKHGLEFALEGANSRWRHSAELLVNLGLLVELLGHRDEVDEVLWVWLRQLVGGDRLLVIDLLVVVDGLSEHSLRITVLALKVGEIGATASLSKRLGFSESLIAKGQVSNSEVHTFALIPSLGELS